MPYFGLCLGLQVMLIDFARHVLKYRSANSLEFNLDADAAILEQGQTQIGDEDKKEPMRLGLYPCKLVPSTKAQAAYQAALVEERHRHRFELNNDYRPALEAAGMVFSGISPDNQLVEIAELKEHPFMLGTQFHPEFLSRPNRPHPLFVAFIRSACEYSKNR